MSLGHSGYWSHCGGRDAIGVCGRWNGCLVASNHISFCVWGQLCCYLLAAVNKTRWNKICALFASKHLFQPSWLQFISITCLISVRERAWTVFFYLKALEWACNENKCLHTREAQFGLFSTEVTLPPLQNYPIVTFKNCKWLCSRDSPSHQCRHALSKHSQQAPK